MMIWLRSHQLACAWALRRLMTLPFTTLLALLTMGILLSLPTLGWTVLGNLQQLRHAGQPLQLPQTTAAELTLFMKPAASRRDAELIQKKLAQRKDVRDLQFISREATLERMQNQPGLREVLAALPKNPYPDAFSLVAVNAEPAAVENLRSELSDWPQVDLVQLDALWLRRLAAMAHVAKLGLMLLALLLASGLVALIYTSLRLQILLRQKEIRLCQLMGATASYNRRPFLYLGWMQGLLASALAWLLVLAMIRLLNAPLQTLAQLYDVQLTLTPLLWPDAGLLLLMAGTLGWLGAALASIRLRVDGMD